MYTLVERAEMADVRVSNSIRNDVMPARHGRNAAVNPRQVLDAVAGTPMWNAHLARDAESMLSGNFETHFPIKLLAKDLAYTMETAGGPAAVPTVSAVHGVFARAMEEKLGDLDMTEVVKLFDARKDAGPT